MKTTFHSSNTNFFLIVLLATILSACDSEQSAWDKAQFTNSSNGWAMYLKSFHESERASRARAKKAVLDLGESATAFDYRELLFREALSSIPKKTLEDIHSPTLVEEALTRISSLEFKALQTSPTLPAILAYATEFNAQNSESLWKLATKAVSGKGKVPYENDDVIAFIIKEKLTSDGVYVNRSFKDHLSSYVIEIAHRMGIKLSPIGIKLSPYDPNYDNTPQTNLKSYSRSI